MQSHTAVPVPLLLQDDVYRIYFGTRDADQHPRMAYIDVDLNEPGTVLAISDEPCLDRGDPGCFDDNGLYPGSLVRHDGAWWLYYMGRSNGEYPLYYMAIGLATSTDGITFNRVSKAPVLDRTHHTPWMVSTPFVLQDGENWTMWHLAGTHWDLDRTPPRSHYHVREATSHDGLQWTQSEHETVPLRPGETNIASPSVVRSPRGWHMWYSAIADHGYQLGYATSPDGSMWTCHDELTGISAPPGAWDGEMAYPRAFRHKNDFYMLYSGRNFGKEGIGLAVLE